MRDRLTLHTLWVATAIAMLVPSVADPDLWGHLLFGSLLLGGTFAVENGFAYTTPSQPWVNHELLAEGTMAALYRLAGPAGLVALKVGLGLGTLALLWRSAERRSGNAVANTLAVLVALAVMAPGLMIRPQLFTLLFLTATLEILARADYRARGPVWSLPVLAVLWVNVHGGVLAGVGVIAIAVLVSSATTAAARRRAAGAGDRPTTDAAHRPPIAAREAGTACALVVAIGAALLVNPYGLGLLHFLVADVTPQVPISEWAPVAVLDASFPAFKALLIVAAAGMLVVRPRLAEAAIVLATAVVALRHQRHIPLFAIAATPVVAATFAAVFQRLAAVAPAARLIVLGRHGLRAAAVLQVGFAIATIAVERGSIAVSSALYPVQALRFLAQNAIVGNVALPFRWGEYALAVLPAGSRVAVDGRFTTAYPQPLLQDAWRFMAGGDGWQALLERYPTDVVVADRTQAPARLLRDAPDWAYVYSDPLCIVFVRRVARHADVLARFHSNQLRYDRSAVPSDFPAGGAVAAESAHGLWLAATAAGASTGTTTPPSATSFLWKPAPVASAKVLAAWRP